MIKTLKSTDYALAAIVITILVTALSVGLWNRSFPVVAPVEWVEYGVRQTEAKAGDTVTLYAVIVYRRNDCTRDGIREILLPSNEIRTYEVIMPNSAERELDVPLAIEGPTTLPGSDVVTVGDVIGVRSNPDYHCPDGAKSQPSDWAFIKIVG